MTLLPRCRVFDVGGFVRDGLLGIPSKDRDCVIIIENAPPDMTVEQGFVFMRAFLVGQGYRIFVETPEHATIRAHPPERGGLTADFVLARREGPYSDGRRPDWVEVGTLEDDLDRRDFTVNALAREVGTGLVIDRHNGLRDLEDRTLRFVGDPEQRIREDGLRIMRAVRFAVTKGFTMHPDTLAALHWHEAAPLLAKVSEERREQELRTMFAKTDTIAVLDALHDLPIPLLQAMFTGRVRLTSTLKK